MLKNRKLTTDIAKNTHIMSHSSRVPTNIELVCMAEPARDKREVCWCMFPPNSLQNVVIWTMTIFYVDTKLSKQTATQFLNNDPKIWEAHLPKILISTPKMPPHPHPQKCASWLPSNCHVNFLSELTTHFTTKLNWNKNSNIAVKVGLIQK